MKRFVGFEQNLRIMTKYQENFIYTSFIKKLLKIKMVTLLLGHPVLRFTHHSKSDWIYSNNMNDMRISGIEPSSVILNQTWKNREWYPKSQMGWWNKLTKLQFQSNLNTENCDALKTLRKITIKSSLNSDLLMISWKRYESTITRFWWRML